MAQRGKKSISAATISIISVDGRPKPPAELTKLEAEIWKSIVDTKPADWFTKDSHQLLISLCKHVSTAKVLDAQIEKFKPAWLAKKDGLERYKTLTDMREKQTRAITSLSRSMRLTQQARYDTQKAATASSKTNRKPWEFEN